jgi:hypothetical protein
MAYCRRCGEQIDPGIRCPNCGWAEPAAPVHRSNDGRAVASLVLGIVGLVICPVVPSVIAIVVGNEARARLADEPETAGASLARAGVILGWIGVAIVGGALLLFLAAASFGIDT